jgi:hypothetical protein
MTTKNTKTATAVKHSKPMNVARSELLEPTDNPWTVVPKFKVSTVTQEDYVKSVQHCRFFYKTEPLVSTVIDKLVEIGTTELVFGKNKLSDNEFRVFESVKPKLTEFCDQMATEYLLSGFVIPEVGYTKVDKDFLFTLGIKKYPSLELPDSMWVRDPTTVKIKKSFVGDKVSYFVKVPTDVVSFIRSKGVYPDGSKDPVLYEVMMEQYPEFVKAILDGQTEFLLENDDIIRRKYLSDNPYPIPYIQSALEALHHKRKLRRMDYSIIDKVISAIMHVKIGDKDFPITQSEEDQEYVENIASQLRMRGQNEQVLERIFQLITNHTVSIEWIFPETEALLNQDKYNDINQEILFGLGFPRILITGEAQKSGTSDSEIATLSPIKTAEDFRRKIIEVIRDVCTEISKRNGFTSVPSVEFKAINLHKFQDLINALRMLYDTASLSRTTLDHQFGFDFDTEVDNLEVEMKALQDKGLQEFGATPNSKNSLLQPGQDPAQQATQPGEKPKTGDTTSTKPKKPAKTGGGV